MTCSTFDPFAEGQLICSIMEVVFRGPTSVISLHLYQLDHLLWHLLIEPYVLLQRLWQRGQEGELKVKILMYVWKCVLRIHPSFKEGSFLSGHATAWIPISSINVAGKWQGPRDSTNTQRSGRTQLYYAGGLSRIVSKD